MMDNDRLAYSLKEFCLATTLSDRTARNLIYSGQLKARRVGSKWIIPVAVAKAFMQRDHEGRNGKPMKDKDQGK
jgi:hypothetical protein